MRRLLTTSAFIFSCCCALAAQENKSQAGRFELKGPVRSVRVEHARRAVEGGKVVESPRRLLSLTTYDESGTAVERTTFDHRGAIQSRETYGRDEQGNSVTSLYGPDGKLRSRSVSQTDGPEGAGRFVLAIYGPSGEVTKHSIQRRMAGGRIAEQDAYDERGVLIQRNVYTYDGAGRQVETTHYGPEGRLRHKTVWPAGGGLHFVTYDNDGSLFLEQRNEPPVVEETDSHGNWTKKSERVTSTQGGGTREYIQITYRAIEYHAAKKQ